MAGNRRNPGLPSAEPSRRVTIRLTPDQAKTVGEYAHACGQTLAGFISQLVLDVDPGARRRSIRAAIVAVHRASLNLRQLLNLAERGIVVAPDLQHGTAEILAEVRELLAALLRADAAWPSEPGA